METVIGIGAEDFCQIIAPKNHMLWLVGELQIRVNVLAYSLVRKAGNVYYVNNHRSIKSDTIDFSELGCRPPFASIFG
jgi:hypothetical protein